MMKAKAVCAALAFVASVGVVRADDLLWFQKDELKQVKSQIGDELTLRHVAADVPGRARYVAWLDGEVEELLAKPGGFWMEYSSVDHPYISHHGKAFAYVSFLVRAYFTPGCKRYQDESTWESAEKALRHYLTFVHAEMPEKKPHNWWAWEIGIPTQLLQILILSEERMSRDLFEAEVRTVAHLLKAEAEVKDVNSWIRRDAKVAGLTDMNQLWHHQLRMRLGVLVENPRMAGVWSELTFGEMSSAGEGSWQRDGSYKFHGACPMWAYGRGFIYDYAKLIARYRGTSFGPDETQLNKYATMLDGFVNGFLYRGRINPAMIGREISRGERVHYNGFIPFALAVMSLTEHRDAERFGAMFSRELQYVEEGMPQFGRMQSYGRSLVRKVEAAKPVDDIFAYPDSDFLQITRLGWSLGIKMHSKRNCGFESINRENMQGQFLSHGSMFHYIDGTEWDGAWSTIDWTRLPGTTVARDVKEGNTSRKVGVLRWSPTRAAACQEITSGAFRARKSWVVDGDKIFCMGSVIEGPGRVETIVANQPIPDDAPILVAGKKLEGDTYNEHVATKWVWVDGMAYVFKHDQPLRIIRERRTSDWSAIRDETIHGKGEVITQTYATIIIEHGFYSKFYSYTMLPKSDRPTTDNWWWEPFKGYVLKGAEDLHRVALRNEDFIRIDWKAGDTGYESATFMQAKEGEQEWSFNLSADDKVK